MVKYGEITEKSLSVGYLKDDIEGYDVSGIVTYNRNRGVSRANGDVCTKEGSHVARFNVYGEGENARINVDCKMVLIDEMNALARLTLTDLAQSYPEE